MRRKFCDRNRIVALIITIALVVLILCIGPFDVFTHGNYCDVTELSSIGSDGFLGQVSLEDGPFTGEFTPMKRHFVGFELNLVNIPKEESGIIVVSVTDAKGKTLDSTEVDLKKITEQKWYRVYLDANLKVGTSYFYTVESKDCSVYPCLQIVSNAYLEEENIDNGVLVGYIYAESTFSFPEKALLIILIFTIWLFCISRIQLNENNRKIVNIVVVVLMMIFGLSWNFMYNSLDNHNDENFAAFQEDSETLATGVILAEKNGISASSYGLGRFVDLRGSHKSKKMSFLTDKNWICGYSRTNPQILVSDTNLSRIAGKPGNYLQFSNGRVFQILEQEVSGNYLKLTLESDSALNYYEYGDLLEAVFLDGDMQPLETKSLSDYKSQYGLQGKIFKHLARYINENSVFGALNLLCCMAAAVTFSIIVLLVSKKYNALMGGIFFIVFLLSPWIVNFARNLYWVEFTWFIPMIVGLFCSLYIGNRKCRILSYIMAFISVLVKCLCGYEYITVVMMGLIMFLLTDMIVCFINKDKKQSLFIFKSIFIIGIFALLGFAVAICIHANIRGEGNIVEGIKRIIIDDVLRRTIGGDMNDFSERYWASFNASSWEVFRTYFHFKTEVIAGVASNLFPILCITPIIIFIYNWKTKKIIWNDAVLYGICFISSVSWFILGKQHSYIHTHMNYVLWYFGYVQICFYVIIKQIWNTVALKKTEES